MNLSQEQAIIVVVGFNAAVTTQRKDYPLAGTSPAFTHIFPSTSLSFCPLLRCTSICLFVRLALWQRIYPGIVFLPFFLRKKCQNRAKNENVASFSGTCRRGSTCPLLAQDQEVAKYSAQLLTLMALAKLKKQRHVKVN